MGVNRFEAPLATAARTLQNEETTPQAYLNRLWDRIEQVEPELHAFVDEPGRRERVAAEAAAVTNQAYTKRPSLYGVPIGVKDIFNVQGMLTRGGSTVPPDELTGPEALIVTRLREAGGIVMGKTVTTEFAYAAPGPTRNPHDLEHTPGGSSSGSAAGVAAGYFPLAIGSQTGGSVIRPAAFCGIVGFKPTYGRIPTAGVLPLSESLDTVGLFTQDIPGMRLAAAAACTDWEADEPPAYDPTLGIPSDAYLDQATEIGRDSFQKTAESLNDAGYAIHHTDLFEEAGHISDQHQTVMAAETALAHHDWFESYEDHYREETADFIKDGRAFSIEDLGRARSTQRALRATVREIMNSTGIDVWISPAAPGPAPRGLDSTGSSIMNRFWTYVGSPAITIPSDTTAEGLPLGLQCTAANHDDERLLAWASDLQQAIT